MKNYTAENFIELLNKIDFSNYQTFSCVNKAYLDFITKLITAIDTLCPSKKIRIKGNTKAWFDSEVISIINKHDDYYKKFNSLGLETDKDSDVSRVFLGTLFSAGGLGAAVTPPMGPW